MQNLMTVKNVKGYVDKTGTAFLNLEDVARGLGFIKKDIKNGKEYIRIDKPRVLEYLESFGKKFPKVEDEFIPENIFYKLCMKANNETARAFQDLVCDEILPTIRKTGGYIAASENDTDEDIMAKAILVAQKTIERKNERIKHLETKIEDDAPRVAFAETIEKAADCILVREFSKVIATEGIDLGERRLYKWFREKGFIFKNSTEPMQSAVKKGLFKVSESVVKTVKGDRVFKTTKITGKGQIFFLELLKKEFN